MTREKIELNEGNGPVDRFRDFVENFPGAVFIFDLKPDGTDLVEYISHKCFDIFEISSEAAIVSADPIWNTIVPEDVPRVRASIRKSADELSGWYCRWRAVTESKKEKWLEGWGQPRKLPDGTVRWNSMILDVTRQRNAEIALDLSRDRALSVRHLENMGTLSSGIAHDFNNLLTVVAGNLDLLRMKLGDQQQFEPILESLSRAVYRGASLARNLLSFSRRHQSMEETLELSSFADQFADLCRRTLSQRLNLNSVYEAPVTSLTIDVGALQNALLNLVLNSRDAVKEDGAIEVRYSIDDICNELVVSVTDDGCGMADEVKAHLFEPFFTTKPIGKGTGLGLSLVQSFVEQYEGTVKVDSRVGKGTTVSMRFPLSRIQSSGLQRKGYTSAVSGTSSEFGPKSIGSKVGKVPTILVVEDDDDIRDLVVEILKMNHFDVINAANGDDAFAILQTTQPVDLVLSDVMMPGKLLGTDLVEVARVVRPNLPMILMSGYVDSSRGSPLDVLSRYPDVPLLNKPMRPDEILMAVRNCLPSFQRL